MGGRVECEGGKEKNASARGTRHKNRCSMIEAAIGKGEEGEEEVKRRG
jgi:hypothetical protein